MSKKEFTLKNEEAIIGLLASLTNGLPDTEEGVPMEEMNLGEFYAYIWNNNVTLKVYIDSKDYDDNDANIVTYVCETDEWIRNVALPKAVTAQLEGIMDDAVMLHCTNDKKYHNIYEYLGSVKYEVVPITKPAYKPLESCIKHFVGVLSEPTKDYRDCRYPYPFNNGNYNIVKWYSAGNEYLGECNACVRQIFNETCAILYCNMSKELLGSIYYVKIEGFKEPIRFDVAYVLEEYECPIIRLVSEKGWRFS